MKSHFKFFLLLSSVLTLLLVACNSPGTSTWWLRPYYDSRGSGFYPFPSKSKADTGDLGIAWSLDRVCSGNISLLDLAPDKGLEVLLTLYPFRPAGTTAVLRGDGSVIDSVSGCYFMSVIPEKPDPIVLVVKRGPIGVIHAGDKDPLQLLYRNLHYYGAVAALELSREGYMAVDSAQCGALCMKNGRFSEITPISLPPSGPIGFVDVQNNGKYDIVSVKQPGYYDSAKLLQLLKRGYHNNDYPDFVPVSASDYIKNVRTCVLFDIDRDRVMWRFPTASGLSLPCADDLTGDGFKELIFDAYSPHNSVSTNNFTDYGQGYIFALDRAGNLLWRYERMGMFLRYHCAVLKTRSGNDKRVIGVGASYYGTEGEIVSISCSNGTVIRRKEAPYSFLGLTLFDSDRDGEEEIFTGTAIGKVFHMDKDLNIIREYSGRCIKQDVLSRGAAGDTADAVVVFASNDIDGDGDVEVFAIDGRFSRKNASIYGNNLIFHEIDLLIFSSDLRLKRRIKIVQGPVPGSIDQRLSINDLHNVIGDIDGDGLNEMLLIYDNKLRAFKMVRGDS